MKMKRYHTITLLASVILMLMSCSTYYVPPRTAGNYSRTYVDQTHYRPNHYRNFYGSSQQSSRSGSDDLYRANTYVDTHAETGKPVYHTTYTTSYNSNGEVTTTYTTDYAGSKKETQYYNDVRKEQKRAYSESRKNNKRAAKAYGKNSRKGSRDEFED